MVDLRREEQSLEERKVLVVTKSMEVDNSVRNVHKVLRQNFFCA